MGVGNIIENNLNIIPFLLYRPADIKYKYTYSIDAVLLTLPSIAIVVVVVRRV